MDNEDWPALLAAYEAAIADFSAISRALTSALVDSKSGPDDVQALLAAEARAKDAVTLARMRLVNLWRASQGDFELPPLPTEGDGDHV